MKKFLIEYIEDNEHGVYPKAIIVSFDNIRTAFTTSIKEHPTLFGIKELHGPTEESLEKYYTHEMQDMLWISKKKMIADCSI